MIINHRLSANHDFKPSILYKKRNRRKREIVEMFFIKKYKETNKSLNFQKDTDNLNAIHDKIIT